MCFISRRWMYEYIAQIQVGFFSFVSLWLNSVKTRTVVGMMCPHLFAFATLTSEAAMHASISHEKRQRVKQQ